MLLLFKSERCCNSVKMVELSAMWIVIDITVELQTSVWKSANLHCVHHYVLSQNFKPPSLCHNFIMDWSIVKILSLAHLAVSVHNNNNDINLVVLLTELVLCTSHNLSCAVNSSHCVLHDASPMCLCHPGFSGVTCDVNVDDCRDVTCQHGGTCVDATLAYHCACTPGYTGNNDDYVLCFSSLIFSCW